MKLVLLLVVASLLTSCGRSNSDNYHCSTAIAADIHKRATECNSGYLTTSYQGCYTTLVKSLCEYKGE